MKEMFTNNTGTMFYNINDDGFVETDFRIKIKDEIKELVTKIEIDDIDLTNDLTREMDTYLKGKQCKCMWCTYIYSHSITGDTWAIRYPGATRGHIRIDKDNIITEIKLYDNPDYKTDFIYEKNVRECFKKYIGMKFIVVPKS